MTATDAQRVLSALFGADAVLSVAEVKAPDRSGAFSQVDVCDVRIDGRVQRVVVRTASPGGPWHGPEDVARQMFWYSRVSGLPRHPRVLTLAAADAAGQWHRLACTPAIAVVEEFVAGEPYSLDLARIRTRRRVTHHDHRRASLAAGYLADIHCDRTHDERAYLRGLRELVGGTEGIMSVVSLYPRSFRSAHRTLLARLQSAVAERAIDLQCSDRPVTQVHGDFHPGNILFTDEDVLSVVDRGRIERDEPAVDVGAALINYLALGLIDPRLRTSARALADTFLTGYLDASGDAGLAAALPVHTAMRAAAVASPTFYPNLDDGARIAVLSAGITLAGLPALTPDHLDKCFIPAGGAS